MSGNVWEWTCSVYDKAYPGGETRCANPGEGGGRALRGGSWINLPRGHRAAIRGWNNPEYWYDDYGFRLARTP
jgi:formylglycine-generating enzyme required for sulfatase activity